jgi:hypothetical protein
MKEERQTIHGYFRVLTTIHAAMLLGMLLFALISIYVVRTDTPSAESAVQIQKILLFAVPLLVLAGLLAGFIYFRLKLEQVRQIPDLAGKLKTYRTVQIIRYAILEAPVLFVIVAYLLTGITLYLYLAFVLLFLFVLFRPGRTRAVHDLALDSDQKQMLDDPDYRIPLM